MTKAEVQEKEPETSTMTCPRCEAEVGDSADRCPACLAPLKVARRQGKPAYTLDSDRVNAWGFTLVEDPGSAKTYKRITETELGLKHYPIVDYVVMFDTGGYFRVDGGGTKCFCPVCRSYLTEINGTRSTATPLPCKNTLREEKHGRSGTCNTRTMFAIGFSGME